MTLAGAVAGAAPYAANSLLEFQDTLLMRWQRIATLSRKVFSATGEPMLLLGYRDVVMLDKRWRFTPATKI